VNGHTLGRLIVAAGAMLVGVAALVVATVLGLVARTDVFAAAPKTEGLRAEAVLQPTQGNSTSGRVEFTKGPDGVTVSAQLQGLKPGPHGFHVHEKGDCSAPDASSAGGHFNPTTMPHAGPDAAKRHDGDLGNVTADAAGKAEMRHVDRQLELSGDRSIVGHALVVHAEADDLTSQPSGNAGARVACGVIQAK
jgi:Cu-Zn family superoxide dismutase